MARFTDKVVLVTGAGSGLGRAMAIGLANAGGDTVNSLAAESHTDLDAFLTKYPGARQLLDRDLTPGQVAGVRQRMAAFRSGGGGRGAVASRHDAHAGSADGHQRADDDHDQLLTDDALLHPGLLPAALLEVPLHPMGPAPSTGG